RERLWRLITDLPAVSQCIPGLESLKEITPDEEYHLVVSQRGRDKAFRLTAIFTEGEPPAWARLQIRGKGPRSFVAATGSVFLTEAGAGWTEMQWTLDVSVHGLIGSLGLASAEEAIREVCSDLITALEDQIREGEQSRRRLLHEEPPLRRAAM
ncbi:MAG: hypothetical protein GY953_44755, partial [bacterium]|nr:hypothetical protein [bacterium]